MKTEKNMLVRCFSLLKETFFFLSSLTHFDAESREDEDDYYAMKGTSTTRSAGAGDGHRRRRSYDVSRASTATTEAEREARSSMLRPVDLLVAASDFCLTGFAFLPYLLLKALGTPFRRGFFCPQKDLEYPYKESTVRHYTMIEIGDW